MEGVSNDQGGSRSSHELPVQNQQQQQQQQQQKDLAAFLSRGEEILDTFTQSIRSFEAHSLQIKQLSQAVGSIEKDLKWKHIRAGTSTDLSDDQSEPNDQPNSKRANDSSDSDDDIDQLGSPTSIQGSEQVEQNWLGELNSFLVSEISTGEKVSDKVAEAINKSLRGQPNPEKMKALVENNKRPENVQNLQIPRVDGFLWDQLKMSTKSQDVAKQKTIAILNQALIPLVRALDHTSNSCNPKTGVLTSHIKDAVKFMCGEVSKLNQQRRESIKKELFPKFRLLCTESQPISATGLFGDNLADLTKNMDSSKAVQMTSKGTNRKPFLFKRGGEKQTD